MPVVEIEAEIVRSSESTYISNPYSVETNCCLVLPCEYKSMEGAKEDFLFLQMY